MDFKLVIKQVVKDFKQGFICKRILNAVSFTCEQKKTYALAGSSGSGKSTLMHLCAGLDTPTQGDILITNRSLFSYNHTERAKHVVLVTQKPLLIKELSVIENCMLSGQVIGMCQAKVASQAKRYLEAVGLQGMEALRVGALSGGQQQRLAIARALMVEPAFLLADEPTGSLDETTGQQIIQLLLNWQRATGAGLFISSHNPAVIAQMEVVFTLKDGILMPHYQ